MATREENLKKINEELEQLSDEEIEKVAGGFVVKNGEELKQIGREEQRFTKNGDRLKNLVDSLK